VDIESTHALRRLALRGEITPQRGAAAIEALSAIPMVRYPHWTLLPRVWALRLTLTAYDAAYVALAETLGAPLLTRDTRLAGASGHSAVVELV